MQNDIYSLPSQIVFPQQSEMLNSPSWNVKNSFPFLVQTFQNGHHSAGNSKHNKIHLTTEIISFSPNRMRLLNNAVDCIKMHAIISSYMRLCAFLILYRKCFDFFQYLTLNKCYLASCDYRRLISIISIADFCTSTLNTAGYLRK